MIQAFREVAQPQSIPGARSFGPISFSWHHKKNHVYLESNLLWVHSSLAAVLPADCLPSWVLSIHPSIHPLFSGMSNIINHIYLKYILFSQLGFCPLLPWAILLGVAIIIELGALQGTQSGSPHAFLLPLIRLLLMLKTCLSSTVARFSPLIRGIPLRLRMAAWLANLTLDFVGSATFSLYSQFSNRIL